jgi:hypothetical protein
MKDRPAVSRIDRGAFLKLSVSLVAGGAALSGCSGDDDATPGTGGQGGSGAGASGGSGGVGGASGGSGGSGGTTGGSAGSTSGACGRDAVLTHTSSNSHDHLPLVRPITTTLLNGMPFEFALPNESGHIHTLSFTAGQLSDLRAGMSITITSSNDDGHTHTYRVTCA